MGFLRKSTAPNEPKGPKPTAKRTWKLFLWGLIIIFLGVVLWVGVTGLLAFQKIEVKNAGDGASFFRFSGDIPAEKLRQEGDGRINILIIGIGGNGHKGGMLADTIQVASIDPINKALAMVSVPRDLYVSVPGNGRMKINSVYADGVEGCRRLTTCDSSSDQGGEAMKKTVSQALDLPIHYFVRLDFQGFEKAIDTLGGVSVYVEKPLNDPHYPDSKLVGYEPLYIPAGLQTFKGALALKYARSRQSTSDFDRSRRQQQIILAAKEKALKLNILANPKKITDLITILGDHLRTDLQSGELTKVVGLVNDLNDDLTVSKVLDTNGDGPLRSINDPAAGYIIVPRSGINDFSEIQDLVHSLVRDPYLLKESPRVTVNYPVAKEASGIRVVNQLKALGYRAVTGEAVARPPLKATLTVRGYKPYSTNFLKNRFSAAIIQAKSLGATDQSDLILTLGSTTVLK